MSTCESECDCGAPGGYPHEPDCHSFDICDEGKWCDKHFQEELMAHVHLRRVSRHQIYNDQQAIDERNQELRDAGRGHLCRE